MEKKNKPKENTMSEHRFAHGSVPDGRTDGLTAAELQSWFIYGKKKKNHLHMTAHERPGCKTRWAEALVCLRSVELVVFKKNKKCPDGRTTFTDRLPPTDEWSKTFFFVFIHQTSQWAGIWNASIIKRGTGPTEQQNRCSQIYRRQKRKSVSRFNFIRPHGGHFVKNVRRRDGWDGRHYSTTGPWLHTPEGALLLYMLKDPSCSAAQR